MDRPIDSAHRTYEPFYDSFDAPLMRQLRREAYDEDIGQHSWVTAADLRSDAARLALPADGVLLDLGCGPCGPLTFVMLTTGCHGIGLDVSPAALEAGRTRAESLGVALRLRLEAADLDEAIPLPDSCVHAAMSLDVVLHVRDRLHALREVARVLKPGARVLFTDAGVVTGSISNEEVSARCLHGFSQFCAPGFNERMLEQSGFVLVESENRTAALIATAVGRRVARVKHQAALERIEAAEGFARYQAYLQAVISLAERGALSRMMYLAQRRDDSR